MTIKKKNKVMKANEAPKKIYLQENTTTDCYEEFLPEWFEARAKDSDVEYTRTDAFIEKAENFLEMLGYGFIITDNITHTNYDKEQLIEDFEEYLKK